MYLSKLASLFYIALISFILTSCADEAESEREVKRDNNTVAGEYVLKMTDPPYVPERGSWDKPEKVVVKMEVIEQEGELMDGTRYTFWTFGGVVPGKFIRVYEGDLVEFHLRNNENSKVPHNIDLHAVNGPGGGAEATIVAPGQEATFTFKALNPGLYIYHCATAPVGMHIANGMYGLILVEDRDDPLPEVDKEFYLVQGEFYTEGDYGAEGLQAFSMPKAIDEEPDYVVFNGKVGAHIGDRAMEAEPGDRVRLYIGNAGPNLVSSFHVIGEIFDRVWVEGGSLINENVQSTVIPAGGAAIVDFKIDVPGVYHLVDHSIFRAFNKGALAQIKVEGEEDREIFAPHTDETNMYNLEGSNIVVAEEERNEVVTEPRERDLAATLEYGKTVYMQNCASCHQANGAGITGVFPPLAKSDYLAKLPDKGVSIVKKGLSGAITVNGTVYNSVMPALNLKHEETAAVLTYVRKSWGNNLSEVTVAEAK